MGASSDVLRIPGRLDVIFRPWGLRGCYSNAELAGALGTPLVEALEQLDRLAKEVMPAFRGAKVAAAAE